MPTYVYGVTDAANVVRSRSGIDGGEPRVLSGEGLHALVGSVPDDTVEANRENLLAHSDVVQDAVEAGPVVPMRFGMVFADDAAVRYELLERRRSDLAAVLDRIRDAVELTVKAYYDQDAVLSEIVAGNPTIRRLQASTRALAGDAGYYERIRLGELVAKAVESQRERDAAALVDRLRSGTLDVEVTAVVPERMVTKAAFLVPRNAVDKFRDRVDELAAEQAGRMSVTLVGPLPPYSFVELTRAEGAAV